MDRSKKPDQKPRLISLSILVTAALACNLAALSQAKIQVENEAKDTSRTPDFETATSSTKLVDIGKETTPEALDIHEIPVEIIPLSGPASRADAEFSGLTWYRDYLILLPQFPQRISPQDGGALLALSRAAILDYLDGRIDEPLHPLLIPLDTGGIEKEISWFEGFEAIAFMDERVFLTIEARRSLHMVSYLVAGHIQPDLGKIQLEASSLVENPLQSNWDNKSDESLLIVDNTLISLYEVYGEGLNDNPHATWFDSQLNLLGWVPFPAIEYRVTDASEMDSQGRFWVINYFFPGEFYLFPEMDPIADQFGEGSTHSRSTYVERLLELQFSPDGINFSGSAPIQLQLSHDGQARNWEGLARLHKRGFLLITDKFPGSILGFVPYP